MDATTSINKTDWAQSKSFSSAPSRSGVEDDGYPLANRLVLPAHSDEIDGAVVEDGAAAVEVRVAVRIAQMLKVESNTFRCTFDLELSWRDDTFRPVVDKEVPFASIVWSRHFRPRWFLANCVELHSLEADAPGTYALAPDPDTRAPVARCVEIRTATRGTARRTRTSACPRAPTRRRRAAGGGTGTCRRSRRRPARSGPSRGTGPWSGTTASARSSAPTTTPR